MNHYRTTAVLLMTCLLGSAQLATAKTSIIDEQVLANAGNQWIEAADKGERLYAEGGAKHGSPSKGDRNGVGGAKGRAEGGA